MNIKPTTSIQVIEKERWYWVRKPHDIPTTWWNEVCFLDVCAIKFASKDRWINLISEFTREEERWLINRLDNETAWYVWFVKNHFFKQGYIDAQKSWKINKLYVAQISWIFEWEHDISIPLMHHRTLERMVCATWDQVKFWRWKLILAHTTISSVLCDYQKSKTWIIISIKKWTRHQIRCHCSFMWFPIIWDSIYWLKSDYLQLYSIDLIRND